MLPARDPMMVSVESGVETAFEPVDEANRPTWQAVPPREPGGLSTGPAHSLGSPAGGPPAPPGEEPASTLQLIRYDGLRARQRTT
jgi:hypothetical protein